MGVCNRILRDTHEADDAFQATFLVLVQKASSLTNRQALASWLYAVAYRGALDVKIRNARRQRRERQVAMRQAETPAPEPQDWRPVLDQELNALPEKYKAAVVLCDLQGRPRREAARQLHLPEGTLSSRLATARRMLAQRLARRGVALSGGALAVSLSEATACVPPILVGTTTKAALLVAAGRTAALSTSLAEILKGTTQAMLFAKLKPALVAVMAIVLGAGTVVYCANGQSTPTANPPSDLEALRLENELLKINLRVTLEKIKALEAEVSKPKGQARVGIGAGAAFADFDLDGQIDIFVGNEGKVFKNRGDGTFIDVTAAREQATKARAEEMDSALKLLRAANDAQSQRSAVEKMEQVMKKLRDEVGSKK
jgi:RNA polymerase sigma factor (sigma-70 family)